MLEILAVLTGAMATVLLLGRPYFDNFRMSPLNPEAETSFDQRAGSIGTVVPSASTTGHDLWVRVGGELWKAEAIGARPPVGANVEVVSTRGSVVSIRLARELPLLPSPSDAPYLTKGRMIGLAFWGFSVFACWLAVGSPLLALIGVPLAWGLAFLSLGVYGMD